MVPLQITRTHLMKIKKNYTFEILLILGIIVRVVLLGIVPAGGNYDECYAGYEAWALLTRGVDSWGYNYPMYLITWGGGMNALYTYLLIPFIKIGGLNLFTIRIPQVIVGILTLPALYATVKRLFDTRTAEISMFLLTISPWHIMMCRWGLESNLAVGFIVFTIYFFVRSFDRKPFIILCALFAGFCLYAYATMWIAVPILLFLFTVYSLMTKKVKFNISFVIAIVLLLILALPAILFVLVNLGYMDEVRTPYFSIPRLMVFRSDEVGSGILFNVIDLLLIIFFQTDRMPWVNSIVGFGTVYYITPILCRIGIGKRASSIKKAWKEKQFEPTIFVIIYLLTAIILGITIYLPRITNVNILFIPLLILAAIGIKDLKRRKLILVIYFAWFLCFICVYFTIYQKNIKNVFNFGLDSAIKEASIYSERIVFSSDVAHPQVLFYTQTPPDEYYNTVVYDEYSSTYLLAKSFGNYSFGYELESLDFNASYILSPSDDIESFKSLGFVVIDSEDFGKFSVLYYPS